MNGKAFPFISVVSNSALSKQGTEDNKRFLQTRTTPGRKRPGSQAERCMPARLCFPGHRLLAAKEDLSEGNSRFPLPPPSGHTTVREGRGLPHFSPSARFSAKSKKSFTCTPFYHSISASFCIHLELATT